MLRAMKRLKAAILCGAKPENAARSFRDHAREPAPTDVFELEIYLAVSCHSDSPQAAEWPHTVVSRRARHEISGVSPGLEIASANSKPRIAAVGCIVDSCRPPAKIAIRACKQYCPCSGFPTFNYKRRRQNFSGSNRLGGYSTILVGDGFPVHCAFPAET